MVDTQESAEYCTEFLKDKQLYKDVLVLSNVPDKPIEKGFGKKLNEKGHLVLDILEISRRHPNLEKGIRYFLGHKVVCKDFDTAA